MKKILILAFLLISSVTYAAESSKVEVRATIDDGTSVLQDTGAITKYFTSGARQQQSVSLTASAYTTLSVPSGAKGIFVDVGSVDGIKLKGLTGDQGISLDSTIPVMLPLSTDGTVTIGFQNMEASAQTIKVYWF